MRRRLIIDVTLAHVLGEDTTRPVIRMMYPAYRTALTGTSGQGVRSERVLVWAFKR